MKIVDQSMEVLWVTPEPLKIIELAARTCYKSEDKIEPNSELKLIRKVIISGHESVLEHAVLSVKFITDRAVTHELVRHRIISASQESQRYVSYYGKPLNVISPFNDDESEEAFTVWSKAVEHCENAYNQLIDLKIPPQIARSVLPNCTKTEIVVTANFREWRHIISLRCDHTAHPQIRRLIRKVYDWFYENYPIIVEDLDINGTT